MLFRHSSDGFLSWDWVSCGSSFVAVVEGSLNAHSLEEIFEVLVHLVGRLNVGLVQSLFLIFFADLDGQFEDLSSEILEDCGEAYGCLFRDGWSVGSVLEVAGYSSDWENESSLG